MRRLIIALAAGMLALSTPALADETSTAVSAAAGAAVGSVASQMIDINGQKLDCNALDIRSMSSDDISKIKSACDTLVKSPTTSSIVPSVTPEAVREWGSLAKEFGSAIGATAKELGIAVNEFLNSPAGILLTLYLFWSKLGGVMIGVPFLITVWYAYFKLNDRYRRTPSKMEVRPSLFGLRNKEVVTEYTYNTEKDTVFWAQALSGVAVIVGSVFVIAIIIL